jgi:DNA-binding phage protein
MSDNIYDYDPAEALDSQDAIAIFLADALETGLSREQLYRSFSGQGNHTLKTMLAVTRALGVDLTTRPHQEPVVVQNPQE